jgi:beta-glucosidase
MLFGDAEPAGRLPVTFPADETQGPGTTRAEFPGETDPATGRLDKVHFDEGVNVGYRFFDAHDQQPLFPFGFGLGYGDVTMDALGVSDGAGGAKVVRVHLRNAGSQPSSAVPQVYLGFPAAAGEPPRQLKGFAKVQLQPGEERDVEVAVPATAFRYWDADKSAWVAGGANEVMLGRSSRDIVWKQAVAIPPS